MERRKFAFISFFQIMAIENLKNHFYFSTFIFLNFAYLGYIAASQQKKKKSLC
jgi:hypothetical protein